MGNIVVGQEQGPEKKKYRTLGLVDMNHATTHMFSALMPIVYPSIMQEYGFGYAQLGFMVGLGNTAMSLLQGAYAFMMHRVLRKVLLASGNLLLAISVGLMAITGGFVPFFFLNFLARVSNSPQHPVGNSLVAENFGKKLRGTAFAVNFAGGNAGTLLVPALGTLGIATLGWRSTLGIFSLIAFVSGFLSLMIPEKRLSVEKAVTSGGRVRAAGRAWVEPLRDKNFRQVVIAASVAAGGRGIGVVMVFVPMYLQQDLHLDKVSYATLFTIMMIGSVVGPLIIGRISDTFSRKWTAIVTYLLSFVATVSLLLAGKSMTYLVVAIAFLGVVVYSQSSQIQALIADVSSKEKRDMAFSLFFTVSYLAGGIWSFILGLAVDQFGFTGAFIIMSLSYIAGVFSLLRLDN